MGVRAFLFRPVPACRVSAGTPDTHTFWIPDSRVLVAAFYPCARTHLHYRVHSLHDRMLGTGHCWDRLLPWPFARNYLTTRQGGRNEIQPLPEVSANGQFGFLQSLQAEHY